MDNKETIKTVVKEYERNLKKMSGYYTDSVTLKIKNSQYIEFGFNAEIVTELTAIQHGLMKITFVYSIANIHDCYPVELALELIKVIPEEEQNLFTIEKDDKKYSIDEYIKECSKEFNDELFRDVLKEYKDRIRFVHLIIENQDDDYFKAALKLEISQNGGSFIKTLDLGVWTTYPMELVDNILEHIDLGIDYVSIEIDGNVYSLENYVKRISRDLSYGEIAAIEEAVEEAYERKESDPIYTVWKEVQEVYEEEIKSHEIDSNDLYTAICLSCESYEESLVDVYLEVSSLPSTHLNNVGSYNLIAWAKLIDEKGYELKKDAVRETGTGYDKETAGRADAVNKLLCLENKSWDSVEDILEKERIEYVKISDTEDRKIRKSLYRLRMREQRIEELL